MSAEKSITRNTDNLKKELTLPLVFCVGLKQIVGAGFISLTGIAIAMAGAGVPLAYFIAAATSILAGIPFAILGSAMPVTGGMYTWPSRILSPMTGFMSIWIFFLSNFTLSVYAYTAADYMLVFYPALNKMYLALGILTVFFLLNLLGARATATVGMALTLVMVSAILLFITMGLPEVNVAQVKDVTQKGVQGIMSAAGLLIFTTFGAAMVSELGGEMKNPGRDIPITIIGATAMAAVIYILAGIVAVGVLPIETVANQKLTLVAGKVMPGWAFTYFTIGAGIISILGIINAQMLWGSKSLLVACDDNWLPRWLGSVNKRFGTPHFLLACLYFVGVFPIVTGLSIEEMATASNITAIITQIIVVLSAYVLFKKYRAVYNRAQFKVSGGVLAAIVIIAVTLNSYLVKSLFDMIGTKYTAFIVLGWIGIGFTIAVLRRNHAQVASLEDKCAEEAACRNDTRVEEQPGTHEGAVVLD